MILAPVVLRKSKVHATLKEDQSKAAVGFRVVYVFDQTDTEGKPLCELSSAQGDPPGYTEKLKRFITERSIQLEYSGGIYPAQGQCSPGRVLLLGQSAADEYATLAHEAAHSLLHMQEGPLTLYPAEGRAHHVALIKDYLASAVQTNCISIQKPHLPTPLIVLALKEIPRSEYVDFTRSPNQ